MDGYSTELSLLRRNEKYLDVLAVTATASSVRTLVSEEINVKQRNRTTSQKLPSGTAVAEAITAKGTERCCSSQATTRHEAQSILARFCPSPLEGGRNCLALRVILVDRRVSDARTNSRTQTLPGLLTSPGTRCPRDCHKASLLSEPDRRQKLCNEPAKPARPHRVQGGIFRVDGH